MDLQTFCYEQKTVRTQQINGEPFFCLKDICDILDIKNYNDCKNRLNEKGVVITDTLTKGGKQQVTFINESNLYKIIFQSRKPEAEKFTDWVTSEVLPAIRKTGKYEVAPKPTRTTERTAEVMLNWAKTVIKELVDKEDYKAKYEIFAYCAEAAGLTDFPIPNCAAELLYKEDIPLSVRNILIRLDSTVKNENMSYNYLYKDIVAQYGSSRKIKKNSFWKIVLQWATSKGYTVRQFRSNGDKRITFVDSNGYVVLGAEENGVTIC